MRTYSSIVGLLVVLCGGVLLLGRAAPFVRAREIFQSNTIPTDMLNYGPMGKILKQIGVVRSVPNDGDRFPASSEATVEIGANIFQKKRHVGRFLLEANPAGPAGFPSTMMVPAEAVARGYPILSVVADPADLYSPQRGIVVNATGRGRAWERLAYMTYFEDGAVRFATGAGLRLHGRFSRRPDKNRNNPLRNFRLYFRGKYGAKWFLPGLLFGPEADPIKTLVLKRDRYWLFVDAFTLDIARRLGCPAPEVKHAIFYLNGEAQGVYGLMEHVSRRQWRSHIGHNHFLYYRYKSHNRSRTIKAYDALVAWAKSRRVKMSLAEASRHIDLDNYTRHIFSFMFCGDSDWRQGVAVLDYARPYPRWFWINWDMDHSFKDFKRTSKSGKIWEQQAVDLVLRKRGDLRATLLRRLQNDSPEYRAYFIRRVDQFLNHHITPEWLNARLDYYRDLAGVFGRDNTDSDRRLREFCMKRPDFIRRQMNALFDAGLSHACTVKGPPGMTFEIDGYAERSGYRGHYFQTHPITVRVTGPGRADFAYWRVNGERVDEPELVWTLRADTLIEAIVRRPEA